MKYRMSFFTNRPDVLEISGAMSRFISLSDWTSLLQDLIYLLSGILEMMDLIFLCQLVFCQVIFESFCSTRFCSQVCQYRSGHAKSRSLFPRKPGRYLRGHNFSFYAEKEHAHCVIRESLNVLDPSLLPKTQTVKSL